jgi:quercetin dioxygenase-like cupin family protein
MVHMDAIRQGKACRRSLMTIAGLAWIAALSMLAAQRTGWSITPSGHHQAVAHAQMDASRSSAQSGRPVTVVTPVSCQRLPNVAGKSITTALVDFPPNAYTPRHRHPGSVTAFVLKGILNSQMEGEAVGAYGVGQTWFKAPGAVHLFAENASTTEPAQLLAIFVADGDCGPLTIPD